MNACRRAPAGVKRNRPGGYVQIRRGGELVLLHRWIVERVEGRTLKPWPEEVVMHVCDTPDCFLYEHLRVGTQRDNALDMLAKGRHFAPRGETHGMARLSEREVVTIRGLAASHRKAAVARYFKVSPSHVGKIVSGARRSTREVPNVH